MSPSTWSSPPRVWNRRLSDGLNCAEYVGRPTKWGNPFVIGRDGTRDEVIARYERYLYESGLFDDLDELEGKDLECWCAPLPCHADVLLRLANAE